jgi:chromosome segregation ATPase
MDNFSDLIYFGETNGNETLCIHLNLVDHLISCFIVIFFFFISFFFLLKKKKKDMMNYSKDTGFPKKVQDTSTINNLLDTTDQILPFENQRQNQDSSDKECEDSDKESHTTDEHEEEKCDFILDSNFENIQKSQNNDDLSENSVARSDIATIGSNESENNQQEFDDDEGSISSQSSSSLMESALPHYKETTVCALEVCHNKIDNTIITAYDGLIKDIDTRKENVHKTKSEEIVSNKFIDIIEHQTEKTERSYSKTETMVDADSKLNKSYFNNINKRETIEEENPQPIVLSRESRKEIELKMEDHMSNIESITRDFHNLSKAIESLGQKYDETVRLNSDQDQQVEDVKNKMESLSSVTNDINKMTIEMQDNVKDLQKLTAKVPNFENSFKSINEEIRKNEEEMKAKFDEQNGKFNDEIRNVLSKYNELERKLKFVDESMKKLKEDEMVEQFDLKSQELVGKIWKTQVKSEELERKTNDLEVSLNDKFEELEHKINAINKSDSLINLLEETKIELQDLVQKKIGENEENILKRLEEDRTKKLALMISTVEEEAKKIYGRLEIVESYYEILKKEFKECDAEIMRRMEEENVISDQMIRDKISEAIDLYTTEYDAKVTQRIREAIESYEARVNKLADASFELEATFSEEIQKTAEKRIRVMEEENRKLKEQRRELKNKLEAKEAECFECKIECDRSDEIITGLGKDKFELENKVRQLKSERKRMETQIKETEDQVHEIERTYKEKLEENNEEIRKMKVNFEKLEQQIKAAETDKFWYKGWLDASLVIVVALLIANFYLLA